MLVALGLVVGACGDSDGQSVTTTSTAPTTQTTVPETTTTTIPSTTTTLTATTTASPPMQTVLLAFSTGDGSNCSSVSPFAREFDAALYPIRAAFDFLVAGPTGEEEGQGATSVFSLDSLGTVQSVTLDSGMLIVDFGDLLLMLPNASTTCGSESLLAQLNATAFQFKEVDRVRYEIEGSCDLFYNWLQRECMDYTRDGAEPSDLTTNERAFGSGCTPGTAYVPDGWWFGYIDDANSDQLSFDLACWFSGSAAADAAAEDDEESPPPNDYYIRNVSDTLRVVPVAPQSLVTWLPTEDPADAITTGYEIWLAERANRSYLPGVWLEVVDGAVESIEEQFVP